MSTVHAQPAGAVTLTVPPPPAAGTVCCGGLIAKEHPLDCVSVKLWPAIVSVPVRVAPLLASKAYCTVPLPLPEAPLEMVTHGVLVGAAFQLHPSDAVTATDPVPAAADTVWDPGDSENVQPPPWLMVTVRPATVTVPDRALPVFAATVSCTEASPLPLALEEGTVIHAAFDVAVHRQPPPVFTDTLTVPPPLATFCCVGVTADVHDSAWLMVNV